MNEGISASIVAKYAELDDKIYMSVEESVVLAEEIARRLAARGTPPDVVVGIANGALLMTKVIADRLNCPMTMVSFRRRGSRIKNLIGRIPYTKRLFSRLYDVPVVRLPLYYAMRSLESLSGGTSHGDALGVSGRIVALVDDCIETGQSIRAATDLLNERGATQVIVCCISWSCKVDSVALHGVMPDVYIARRVQHYPWSLNSPFQPDLARWISEAGLQPAAA